MGLLLLRPHDRPMVAWLEENGTGKDGERQRKKREEMERNDLGWKKTARGEPTGSPYPVNSSFRSPLTIVFALTVVRTYCESWTLKTPSPFPRRGEEHHRHRPCASSRKRPDTVGELQSMVFQ
jgi:hypothetical protein